MTFLLSKGLAAPAAALRAGWVLGLVACTLVACHDLEQAGAAPVAQSIAVEGAEDAPIEVKLPASGFGTLVFAIVGAPAHGTVSAVRPDGSVTYTPGADYHGEDALSFRAIDHWGQSAQGKVSITVKPTNDAPTLSTVAHQRIAEDGSTGELAFTLGDAETVADDLTLTLTSSNTALVPNVAANLVVGGSSTHRTLKVVPVANASGSTTITLAVSDGTLSTSTTFTVDVTAVNDAPTASPVAHQRVPSGGSTGELAFTVGDVETAADGLTVSATSSNTALVPNDPSKLVLGGSGSHRTLNVIPTSGVSGTTTITLAVSDGFATTSTTFTVEVTGSASLYWVSASGSLWKADVDGANAVELKTGISGVGVVATDPVTRAVFYKRDNALVRMNSDGSNPVDIVANGGLPSGMTVDATNRKLYWSDFNGNRVMRADLDGTNPTEVVGGLDSPSALVVDGSRGKVYVITYNNTAIIRFNLDGTQVETIASNLGGQGVGMAINSSGGKLYFTTRANSIYVANLDGSNVTTLVTNQTAVHGIAIDVAAGRLYWADWLGEAIRSARLADGGDIQTVKSGGGRYMGLDWMPAP
ncbi:Ig-like domain-containing protein [Myxococcus landrumensis]|uniref:SMP-30/gluconolactonase/LRE family protein n=1 Tax=Myxococcus landrumensis TaxID=2813577 RepID=A0ABX7NDW0_9BACT|nr:Ig-like domain-containing protein [Myxococcus landrumus]QSQ15694.1 SMP-30/gluconolactonase/LRE family protein [Myxococcus landrumus]